MKQKIITGVAVAVSTAILLGLLGFVWEKSRNIYNMPDKVEKLDRHYNNKIIAYDSLMTAKNKVQNKLIIDNRIAIKSREKIDSIIICSLEEIKQGLKKSDVKFNIILEHNKKAKQEWEKINNLIYAEQ